MATELDTPITPTAAPIAAPKKGKTATERKRAQRARDKQRERAQGREWNSEIRCPTNNTVELLQERGLADQNVISHLAAAGTGLIEVAIANQRIPGNKHYVLTGTCTDVPFEPTPTEEIPGELIRLPELRALYDFSVAWREPNTSFEEFLAIRRMVKTDAFLAGRDVHGMDFHEIHQTWSEFFPQLNPDLLPVDYTQEQMKAALEQMDVIKSRLLIASRNSYKSSFGLIWLVSAITVCPDLRALLVSETKPLAAGFIRKLRSYFEIQNPNSPTKFQQYFPEHCIPIGDGSELTFESPAAHLRMIASTAESTSMESRGTAGNRADLILFDDPISNDTVGTVEMRQKSIDKHDLLLKLLEVGSIGSIVTMTPWHEKDLAATLMERNDLDPDRPMLVRIDPAWTLKPGRQEKSLFDVREEDIAHLLFPERLTFKFLRSELMKNPKNDRIFRMQNLCEFLPLEDGRLKLNFTEAALNAAIRSEPKEGSVFNSWDTASSVERYADLSAGIHFKIYTNDKGQPSMHICKVVADRFRYSELAVEVVQLCKESSPRTIIIEKIAGFDLLGSAFKHECERQHLGNFPIFWKQVSSRVSKFQRIKPLETLLAEGRLTFSPMANWDDVVRQFTQLDGHSRSGGNRKDDVPDAIALGSEFLPDVQPDFVATAKAQDQLQRQRDKQAHHDWIFGEGVYSPKPVAQPKPQKLKNAKGAWGLYIREKQTPSATDPHAPVNASIRRNRYGVPIR